MKALVFITFAFVAAEASATKADTPHANPQAQAARDGSSKELAIKVRSVDQEYKILRGMNLTVEQQALINDEDGRAFDVMTVLDPASGAKREVWFDITSFFGKEFGF